MILTVKLGTREESPCSLINDMEIVRSRRIMVRVSSKKAILQTSPGGRVKASPKLLVTVIGRELTFTHKRAGYSEELAVICAEITGSVHAGPRGIANKLAEVLLSVSLHLVVIRIQLSQFLLERSPRRSCIAILVVPKFAKVERNIPGNMLGFLFVSQVMGLSKLFVLR